MSLHVFPFLMTMLKNAMLNIPASLEESGAVFGAGFGQRLRKIFAPLLTGNYAIGALLVFVKTLSEYGTPYTLGRRIGFYVFTTDIHRYSTTAPIDFGRSASLSSILACICMAMWLLQNDITGKNSYCLAAGNFTLDHYKELLTTPKALSAIWKSLFLAVSSATICSVIGTSVVAAVRKSKGFFKKTLEGVSLLPEMLPSIVLVFGIMLFWNAIYKIIPLYNTIWIMVLAYVVDEVKDKMIAGEAAVALVWSGDATFCMSENDELDYMIPPEGSNIFYDSICIPANARNVSGAEKFIDFLCRGDIAAMNYDYVGYAIPNTAAIDIIGADEYNASPVNNPPQEALDHCQVFKYLGDDTKLYDQIWTEIISEF